MTEQILIKDDDVKEPQPMNGKINNRSMWLKGIVSLKILDGIALLIAPINIFGTLISFFIAYRLWNKNKFWRDITAYIAIPLGLLMGFITLETNLYGGIGIIAEGVLAFVLLKNCWDEFTYVDMTTKEDVAATKLWRNIVIVLLLLIAIIIIYGTYIYKKI